MPISAFTVFAVLSLFRAAWSAAQDPAAEVADGNMRPTTPAATEPASSPTPDYGQPHTVPESDYFPPVPRKEKPRRIAHHFYCCPEPHCCDVEKLAVKSKGEAEGELAKTVGVAATLGGEQAEYERKASEHRLSTAEKDEEAPVNIVAAQEEAAVHVAEAKVRALDEELAGLQHTDQRIEKDEEAFNEELVQRKEAEVASAEKDLQELQTEKHKIAGSIDAEVDQIEKDEKQSDLEVKLSEASEELLNAESEAAEANLQRRVHELEREAREAEGAEPRYKLGQRISKVKNEAKDAALRGKAVLQDAEELRESIGIEHPNVGATEQAVMDTIRENESAAEVEEHEMETEEEAAAAAKDGQVEAGDQDEKEGMALALRGTGRSSPKSTERADEMSKSAKLSHLRSGGLQVAGHKMMPVHLQHHTQRRPIRPHD